MTGYPTIFSSYNFDFGEATVYPSVHELTLGRYAWVGDLGSGGFGGVLKVYDTWLDRQYAMKLSDAQYEKELKTEITLLRSLPAQYFVRSFDFSRSETHCWYTMELLDGRGGWSCLDQFSDVMDRMGIGFFERSLFACFIVKEICFGLVELHTPNSANSNLQHFHGDLKPANVFFNADAICEWRDEEDGPEGPFVKIIDLGASQVSGKVSSAWTPSYAAPEQHKAAKCDAKVDVWAVAGILFELLAGNAPSNDGGSNKHSLTTRDKKVLESRCDRRMYQELKSRMEDSRLTLPSRRPSAEDIAVDLNDVFSIYYRSEEAAGWQVLRCYDRLSGAERDSVSKPDLRKQLSTELKTIRRRQRNSGKLVDEVIKLVGRASSDEVIQGAGYNRVIV